MTPMTTSMTSIQDNELLAIVTVMTATMVIMIAMMTMTSTTKSIAMMTFIAGGIPNPSWSTTLDFPLFGKKKHFSEWELNE